MEPAWTLYVMMSTRASRHQSDLFPQTPASAVTTGLFYNIFADVMLGLEFVPTEVYTALTKYYNNLIGE